MTTVTGPSRHGGPDLHSYCLFRLQHGSPHHLPKSSTRDVIQPKKHTKPTKQPPPYHVQQFSIGSYPFFVETVTSLSGGHYMKPTQTITREIPHKFTIPLHCLIPSKKKRFHLMTPVSFPSAPTSNHVAIAAIPRSQSHSPKGPRHLQIQGDKLQICKHVNIHVL